MFYLPPLPSRPGSVGVDAELIFKNQTVLPNATSIADTLTTAVVESKVFIGVIPSSITVGEFLVFNIDNDLVGLFLQWLV